MPETPKTFLFVWYPDLNEGFRADVAVCAETLAQALATLEASPKIPQAVKDYCVATPPTLTRPSPAASVLIHPTPFTALGVTDRV